MKITITIKNVESGKTYDITLDNHQKIKTTLQVLKEDLPESMQGLGKRLKLQSQRTSRHLKMENTYEDSHIYTGDVLLISAGETKEEG